MSQIKKALERAKAARGFEEFGQETVAGRFPSLGALAPVPRCRQEPEPAEILYTHTPVVKVAREDLLKNRLVALEEDDPAADRFKLLRTQVFQHTRSHGWNTILVSGFGAGEGKSTVAANLAISIAKDTRQTALLVDLDFRRPSVERLFHLEGRSRGLRPYFLDHTPLEDLFLNPGIEKLTVLTAGEKVASATELIGSPKMEALIKELKHRYSDRYVIFDAPSITACPDPLIISEYVDTILLVGRVGHTTRESLSAAMERVSKDKLLGVVMNGVPEGESNYC